MKRQLLAGRFGPDDSFDVTAGADEQRTYLQLVAGEKSLDHGIGGALTNLKKIGVFPSEIGIACWCWPRMSMRRTRASLVPSSLRTRGRARYGSSCRSAIQLVGA